MPTPSDLRAAVRVARKEYEKCVCAVLKANPCDGEPVRELYEARREYHAAIAMAEPFGPDPVDEAFERYRAAVLAPISARYKGRSRAALRELIQEDV